MRDLYDILADEKLRSRPAMFMGLKSITALHVWICGLMCADHFGVGQIKSEPPFGEFHCFVREKYGFSLGGEGWSTHLLKVEEREGSRDGAESRAVDRFFSDLDEFTRRSSK